MDNTEQWQATEFEKRRGISQVVVNPGFLQIHLFGLAEPVIQSRLDVLGQLKDAEINIHFLKLTPDGLSFMTDSTDIETLQRLLPAQEQIQIHECSVVLVHAVNMRDEEGLVARVIATAIACGAQMEHVGDMHDRLMIAASVADANRIASELTTVLQESPRS